MELYPILVPADWTPEKDFQAYEQMWGEPKGDYFNAAIGRVAENYNDLIEVVDAALAYFERKDPRLVRVHPDTLPLCEKLARLSSITNTRNASYEYKSRFANDLHDIIWVDNERRRVLENYHGGEEGTWLYPLWVLADYLGCAGFQLWESMMCEHQDYKDTIGGNRTEQ
jgi:hypothetical protein